MSKGDPQVEELLKQLGKRVRRRRKELSLPVKLLAERAGLSPRFVSQVEAGKGNIAIGRLFHLARALGLPLEKLVTPEGPEPSRVVALLGMRGAGKSSIGPKLARKLGLPFVELDERIEQSAGLSLAEIFHLHGEPYYRRLESRCLGELLDSGEPCVVALPGGVVGNEEAFRRIRESCVSVWLKARPEDHMKRVLAQGDRRPMADRSDAMAELRSLLSSREPLYARADLTVDTSACSRAAATSKILETLGG